MTDVVVTTTNAEVLYSGTPAARATALRSEVLHSGMAVQRVSAVRAEVLRSISNMIQVPNRRVTVVVTGD